MNLKNITLVTVTGLAISGFSLSVSNPAHAAIFNVNGTDYDITTITTSYANNSDLLQSQPWWGNGTTASLFANTVSENLGLPNNGGVTGPYFAYGAFIDNDGDIIISTSRFSSNDNEIYPISRSVVTYAVGSQVSNAVPEPLNILGISTGVTLLWSTSSRLKRKKLSK